MEVLISWDVYCARNPALARSGEAAPLRIRRAWLVCSQNIDTALLAELGRGDGIDLQPNADHRS
jgi:hypothetical protein